MCTLRNFPSLIEHCIEWARAQFNDLFVEQAGDAKKFLDDRETYLAEAKVALNAGRGGDLPKKIDTLKHLMVRHRLHEASGSSIVVDHRGIMDGAAALCGWR